MAGKIAPLVDECKRQVESCLYTSTALYSMIRRKEAVQQWCAAVPFVLGSLATWSVIADTGVPWLKYLTAAMTFTAGVIPALMTTLKYGQGIEVCRAAAAEFKALQDRFRQAARITSGKGVAEFEKEFAVLMDRLDLARKECVIVPEWAFKAAQAKIKQGDYTFDVDIIALEREDGMA